MTASPMPDPANVPSSRWREWLTPGLLLPVGSGVALVTGFLTELAGLSTVATPAFWAGILLGGYTFVPGALRALIQRRKVGISLLMTISAIGAIILGYLEEAAALAFLYSTAEMLEDRAMDHARDGLRSLLSLIPTTALLKRNGTGVTTNVSDIVAGDVFIVRPGERVCTDGIVLVGKSSLDTSATTGESMPQYVTAGERVSAGSINLSGALEVEAEAPGTDNSLTRIVELVERAQAQKGERARLADRMASPLIPGVIILALAVAIIGSLAGDPSTWITRGLVVLVAASPCALAISVPVTIVSAVGAASRFGIVVKSGAALEELGTIAHIGFDKTGTLTRNNPVVTDVVAANGYSKHHVLAWAAAVERASTHPIATAIAAAAPIAPWATAVTELPGNGVTGTVDGHEVTIGSPRWIHAAELGQAIAELELDGKTCVVVRRDGQAAGVIAIRDELRSEAAGAIAALAHDGITVSMLTGDNSRTAHSLAAEAGIEDVRAELTPEYKARIVSEMAELAPTAMVGDGINDAPALAAATVGIAMGASGSDAAIESADIAFTGNDLRLIPLGLRHARRTRRIIDQNLALSVAIIAALLPLAISGVFNLAAVVLVHEGAEVLVILNGLRAARAKGMLTGAKGNPRALAAGNGR
ncbi:heavy metal translocating P-type ATPase [Changpingibacter yushuensis]|uniref:heavy metal translocating P-type ATPase n=1 Tax=Changpingibacter yushuensis TaxID=2758440 RepID=UPI00165D9918